MIKQTSEEVNTTASEVYRRMARISSELLAIMLDMMTTNTPQMGSLHRAYGMEPILDDFPTKLV